MNNKKRLFITFMMGVLFPLFCVGFLIVAFDNNISYQRVRADETPIGNHYNAVAATKSSPGIKEYCVDCFTHEIYPVTGGVLQLETGLVQWI